MNVCSVAFALSLLTVAATPVRLAIPGNGNCEDLSQGIYYVVPSEAAEREGRSYLVLETLKGPALEQLHVTPAQLRWCRNWPAGHPAVVYVRSHSRAFDFDGESMCEPGCEPQWSNHDFRANGVDFKVPPELAQALRAQPPTARRDYVRAYLAVKAKPTAEAIAALITAPDLPRRRAGISLAEFVADRKGAAWDIVVASVVRQIGHEPVDRGTVHRDQLVRFVRDHEPAAMRRLSSAKVELPPWWPDYVLVMLDLADEGDLYGINFACYPPRELTEEPRCHADPLRPGKLVPDPGETARLRELVRSGALPARP